MPLFLQGLLAALPAVVSGVSSLFGGGGGGGGFLSGLFGGGGAPAPPTIIQGGARPGTFNPFRTPGIFGGVQPGPQLPAYSFQAGPPLPSSPRGGRTSFSLTGRSPRAPSVPQVRPTAPGPTVPFHPHDFAAQDARAQVGAFGQFQQGHLRQIGAGVVCPRGAPHPLPTIPLSMTPDHLARIRLGASCV